MRLYVYGEFNSKSRSILAGAKYAQNANLAGRLIESCVGQHTIQNPIATGTREFSNARVLAEGKEARMNKQTFDGPHYRGQKLPSGRSRAGLSKPSADVSEIVPCAGRENQLARHASKDSAFARRRRRQFVIGPDALDPGFDLGRIDIQPRLDLGVRRRHQISLTRPLIQILPSFHPRYLIPPPTPDQSRPSNRQKFFASFFQKRRPSFSSCLTISARAARHDPSLLGCRIENRRHGPLRHMRALVPDLGAIDGGKQPVAGAAIVENEDAVGKLNGSPQIG